MMTIDEPGSSAFFTKFTTFLLWAVVSLSAVGWTLRLWPIMNPSSPAVSAQSMQVAQNLQAQSLRDRSNRASSVGTLLGAESKALQSAPDLALARLALVGVIQTGEGQGVALISVDAQNPKPYRIGSKVGDALILSSVEERSVSFKLVGDNSALDSNSARSTSMRLDLPKTNRNGTVTGGSSSPSPANLTSSNTTSTNSPSATPVPLRTLK